MQKQLEQAMAAALEPLEHDEEGASGLFRRLGFRFEVGMGSSVQGLRVRSGTQRP